MHDLDGARLIDESASSSPRPDPIMAPMSRDQRRTATCNSSQDRVAALLNARVARAPACPRCGSARVQRWGKIQGVQRLRCRHCARTFNPLTGTPLARLRRRDLWLGYARVLEVGLSLRRGAMTIGVHYNTSLRWRHRWLERPREQMARNFSGTVAAEIVTFEPCAQQPRGWTRVELPDARDPTVPAGERHLPSGASQVLLLRDECGARADAILSSATLAGLVPVLDQIVEPVKNSMCSDDHPAVRTFCSTRDIGHRYDPSSRRDRRLVVACRRRLQAWMRRFAGVSKHRLANYLGWRRLLETPDRPLEPAEWLDRALDTGQHPTVTTCDNTAPSGNDRAVGDGRDGGLAADKRIAAAHALSKPRSSSTGPLRAEPATAAPQGAFEGTLDLTAPAAAVDGATA